MAVLSPSPEDACVYKVNFHALVGIGNSLGALEDVTPLLGSQG